MSACSSIIWRRSCLALSFSSSAFVIESNSLARSSVFLILNPIAVIRPFKCSFSIFVACKVYGFSGERTTDSRCLTFPPDLHLVILAGVILVLTGLEITEFLLSVTEVSVLFCKFEEVSEAFLKWFTFAVCGDLRPEYNFEGTSNFWSGSNVCGTAGVLSLGEDYLLRGTVIFERDLKSVQRTFTGDWMRRSSTVAVLFMHCCNGRSVHSSASIAELNRFLHLFWAENSLGSSLDSSSIIWIVLFRFWALATGINSLFRLWAGDLLPAKLDLNGCFYILLQMF